MTFFSICDSPLGRLRLISDGGALTGLQMEGQKRMEEIVGIRRDDLAVFAAAQAWLSAYFLPARAPQCAVPLAPGGTAFQRRVWRQVLQIPRGETVTYGQLAAAVDCSSARAVGAAVGRNPILLLIPCHRVVGAGGELTGYAGGLARKQWLLAHERKNRESDGMSRQEYIPFLEEKRGNGCVCP